MRLLTILLLVAGWALFAPAPSRAVVGETPSYRLFVTNYRDDTVSVIDGDRHHEERVLKVGPAPQGVTHRANPPLVAVANSTGSTVTLIDPVALEVLGEIETGGEPEDVVFSKDGKRLYATSAATKAVHVLDVETRREIAKLPASEKGRPVRLQLSPDGRWLYVLVRSTQGELWAIDTETNERVATIAIGVNSNDFALSRDGRWLVSSSFAEDRLYVVDTTSREVVATHDTSTGAGLVMHPSHSRVYSVASFDDAVHVVDFHTGAKLAQAELGQSPQYGTTNPNGSVLYIASEDGNRIIAVDSDNLEQLWRLGVGDEPADIEYVALRPAGDQKRTASTSAAANPPPARALQ